MKLILIKLFLFARVVEKERVMIVKERGEISSNYKWDLRVIYSDYEEFKRDYEKVLKAIDDLKSYELKMTTSALNFYQCLKLSYEIERTIDKMSSYASMNLDCDTRDNDMQALRGEVSNLCEVYGKNAYFIVPSLLSLEYSEVVKFYDDVPELKYYDIVIRRIFRKKKHVLGDKEEKLLSSLGKAFGNNYDTYKLFKDGELSFGNIISESGEEIELSNSNYSIYIESKDRRVRKEAFLTLYDAYKKYKNTFASLLASNMKEEVAISKVKNYKDVIEMFLFNDELDDSIYNNLVQVINNNLDKLHAYYKVKKDILNLEELHLYDVYVPVVSDYEKDYSYEEALEIIFEALSVLGENYVTILKRGILEEGWIDVFPNVGKRGGAYSGGSYDTYPYILLNYQKRYSDVSTIAHEAGHSMHSYFTRTNNGYEYGDYSIFVAEVASTVNELLLARYIFDNTDDKICKLSVLDRLLELFRATMYRQTMFAEFEKKAYSDCENGVTLTADVLCSSYLELNKKYFGKDVVVDDEIRFEWERIPHFYYNFYVYKYATGLAAANFIVKRILNKEENAVSDYLEFLKCGSTKSPLDSLRVAGVDLSKKEVIEAALDYFEQLLEEFKNLYDEVYNK